MHPTFAAMVCKETVSIIKSNLSTFFNANIENGTKMINETSLVMKIELKKQVKTKTMTNSRVFETLTNSFLTNLSKMAKFFKISTISIIKKSNIIVSQLIYPMLGFAKKQVKIANIKDMENTISLLKKSANLAII